MRPITRWITVRGERRSVIAWAMMRGIYPDTLRKRLAHGWSHEAAVFRPLDPRGTHRAGSGRKMRAKGRCLTLRAWATELDVSYQILWQRIRRGWTLCEAITIRRRPGFTIGTERKRVCARPGK
jgi:hypothetical protein